MFVLHKKIIPERGSYRNTILAIIPLYAAGIAFFGERAAVMCLIAAATGALTDYICLKLFKKRTGPNDYSSIISALIYTLLLPVSVPYWLIAAGIIFMLPVAKFCFGGSGYNIFNPAAVGFAFSGICWPELVFTYPSPAEEIPVIGTLKFAAVASPGAKINLGGVPHIRILNILTGQYGGPVGATPVLLIILCFIFLLITKQASIWTPAGAILPVAAAAFFFPRITTDYLNGLMYELISGVFLFGLAFMVHDPSTTPVARAGKFYFGIFLGVMTVIFKYLGNNDGFFIYALLIANPLSCYFNNIPARKKFMKNETAKE